MYVEGSEAAIVGETNSRPNMPSSALIDSVAGSVVGSTVDSVVDSVPFVVGTSPLTTGSESGAVMVIVGVVLSSLDACVGTTMPLGVLLTSAMVGSFVQVKDCGVGFGDAGE